MPSVIFEDASAAQEPLSDSGFTIGWTLQALYDSSEEFRTALGSSKVKKVIIKPLGEGQGFISVVYRVTAEFNDANAAPFSFVLKVPSTRHLETFVSASDDPEESRKGLLVAFAKAHNGECAFYEAFRNTDYIPLPRVWYTRKFEDEKHVGAILMEDLSVKGTNPGIVNSVTIQQIKNVTTLLARFHAKLLVDGVNTDGIEGSVYSVDEFFLSLYQKAVDPLISKNPAFEPLIKQLAPVANVEHAKYALFEYPKALGLPLFLVHGDCWSNNLLFKRNDDGTSSNDVIAFLDWQAVFSGNPMFDLSAFLALSADAEIRREAETFIAKLYFDEFSALLKAAGKNVTFGVDELDKAYKSAFITKAMEAVINTPVMEKTLASSDEGVKEAQLAKMELRTKLLLEDAVLFMREVAQEFLEGQ